MPKNKRIKISSIKQNRVFQSCLYCRKYGVPLIDGYCSVCYYSDAKSGTRVYTPSELPNKIIRMVGYDGSYVRTTKQEKY